MLSGKPVYNSIKRENIGTMRELPLAFRRKP
jgi:hypothetical protein